MDTISNFRLLDDLAGYDKEVNPNMLSVSEMLPYGISWLCDGVVNEIKTNGKVIPLLLRGCDGIALIKWPFSEGNGAYIINPRNEVVWDMSDFIKSDGRKLFFTDVYYIADVLYFFVNIDGKDYRFSFEPKKGYVGKLIPSC